MKVEKRWAAADDHCQVIGQNRPSEVVRSDILGHWRRQEANQVAFRSVVESLPRTARGGWIVPLTKRTHRAAVALLTISPVAIPLGSVASVLDASPAWAGPITPAAYVTY